MSINVEVRKNTNESAGNLIRRFSKRMQGSGVLRRARKNRFLKRSTSKFLNKKRKLKSLTRQAFYEEQVKLGKIQPQKKYSNR